MEAVDSGSDDRRDADLLQTADLVICGGECLVLLMQIGFNGADLLHQLLNSIGVGVTL